MMLSRVIRGFPPSFIAIENGPSGGSIPCQIEQLDLEPRAESR